MYSRIAARMAILTALVINRLCTAVYGGGGLQDDHSGSMLIDYWNHMSGVPEIIGDHL